MILQNGTKVLVSHRRLFEGDHLRYFLGVVDGYEAGVARVTGQTWTREGYRGEFRAKPDAHTKILSLSSGTMIVYQLPASLDLDSARIRSEGTSVVLRDDLGFSMDLSEGHLHTAPQSGYERSA